MKRVAQFLGHRSWEIALAAMAVIMALSVSEFASYGNLRNILIQISPLLLLATGQAFVLITGGIDLGQGAVVSIGSVLLFVLVGWLGFPLGLVTVVLFVVAYYTILAYLVTVPGGGMNPLIVTLAAMYILTGGVIYATGGTPLMGLPNSARSVFDVINNGQIAGLPVSFAIAVLFLALAALFLHKTTAGILVFAVGDNPMAARAHGLSLLSGRVWAYTINGVLTLAACVLLTSRVYQGNPHLGEGLLFDSIGGAVLGGVSLAGGIGGVWYAARGVLLIFLIQNALYLTDLDSSVRDIVVGILILAGFTLSNWQRRIN